MIVSNGLRYILCSNYSNALQIKLRLDKYFFFIVSLLLFKWYQKYNTKFDYLDEDINKYLNG